MFALKDRHIDFILNDISARGVTIEDLQYNLLDHICCIVEQNLEENGDFENFYQKTVQTFFKSELKEIEDETISLIIFKNYYTMKKAMIISGTCSVALLITGLFLKFLHLPGASVGILLGITLLSLVFLPLMFTLKIKEKSTTRDKLMIVVGGISAILLSMGIMFKVFHWPFANIMMTGSIAILLLIFLPFYFINGIRNPETRVNTIVSSIIIIAACGLLFTLYRTPKNHYIREKVMTENYLLNEKLLRLEWAEVKNGEVSPNTAKEIIELCDDLKSKIIFYETGSASLENDFLHNGLVIPENDIHNVIQVPEVRQKTEQLMKLVKDYNDAKTSNESINITAEITNVFPTSISNYMLLNQISIIQRIILQNQRSLLATK